MCEYLDRLLTKGESIGEARGISIGEIRGTVSAYRRFHMPEEQILTEIMELFHLEKEEAEEYLK